MFQTQIEFGFLLAPVQLAVLQQIVTNAGITTLAVSGISASQNVLTVTANRHATAAEKTAIAAAFWAFFPVFTDL